MVSSVRLFWFYTGLMYHFDHDFYRISLFGSVEEDYPVMKAESGILTTMLLLPYLRFIH
jgi:hypothetical protein